MIKIVHIITDLSTGGAEMMLYKMLSAMDRTRFESSVISMMDIGVMGPKIEELGISIYELDMEQGKPTVSAVRRLRKIIRFINPDLIQGWMYHGNLAGVAGKLFSRGIPPVIWNIRQTLYGIENEKKMTRLVIRANSILSKKVDSIIYNSNISAQQHEAFGFTKNTRIILPNGFDVEKFSPSICAYQKLRQSMGLKKDSVVVGMFARYHPMKDYGNLIHAANRVHLKNPEVHFVLVGRDVTLENPVLRELIDESVIKSNLHLLGERQDIHELMGGIDIAVSSSAWGEAFPNALGEAMSCGVPCVVTDVGDSSWILGGNGKVVPAKDSIALAEGINQLINLDMDKRRELGALARQRIIGEFSLDKVAGQYEELYEQVYSEHSVTN